MCLMTHDVLLLLADLDIIEFRSDTESLLTLRAFDLIVLVEEVTGICLMAMTENCRFGVLSVSQELAAVRCVLLVTHEA